MASLRGILRLFALAAGLTGLVTVSIGASAGVNMPDPDQHKGERCVEDTDFMRRNHMDLLKHHRNDTMRKGIRTTKHSLKGCVECHASETTGSVASSKDDFCMACHTFTGVKLDCWDCHATKPKAKPAGLPSDPVASPMMSDVHSGGTH